MLANFVAGKPNQLVGQVASTPANLAALAQVYLAPRFETLRVFFMKGGTIMGESGYSSRLPGSVALPSDISAQVTADKSRFCADGYYLLHNHPSGKANPSTADVAFTRMVQKDVDGFQGHVIDHDSEHA